MLRPHKPGGFSVLSLLLLLGLTAPCDSAAQSFGLTVEAGAAFVENHDSPERSAGVSLLFPLGGTVIGSVSYAQWSGVDANDAGMVAGRFFGERGLNLTIYAPALRTDRLAWLIGAGVGQYERIVRDAAGTDREYQGALSASTMLALGLSDRWSFLLKGLVSVPTAEATPRWGMTHAGLALRL